MACISSCALVYDESLQRCLGVSLIDRSVCIVDLMVILAVTGTVERQHINIIVAYISLFRGLFERRVLLLQVLFYDDFRFYKLLRVMAFYKFFARLDVW